MEVPTFVSDDWSPLDNKGSWSDGIEGRDIAKCTEEVEEILQGLLFVRLNSLQWHTVSWSSSTRSGTSNVVYRTVAICKPRHTKLKVAVEGCLGHMERLKAECRAHEARGVIDVHSVGRLSKGVIAGKDGLSQLLVLTPHAPTVPAVRTSDSR